MHPLIAFVLSFGSEPSKDDLPRVTGEAGQVVAWADRRRAELLLLLDDERDDPAFWEGMIEQNRHVLAAWSHLRDAQTVDNDYARMWSMRELRAIIGPVAFALGAMPTPNPPPRRMWAPWIR